MAIVSGLFARFGLFTQAADTSETFALRLSRLGTRERRCIAPRTRLFRST
jgi:hypothetical protein